METRGIIDKQFEKYYEKYLPMVYHVMKKLNIKRDKEDFLQLGRIAIYEAWLHYDHEKGEFAPYVYCYIHGKLKSHLINELKWQNKHQLYEIHALGNMYKMNNHMIDQFSFQDFIERIPLSKKEKIWVLDGVINHHTPSEIAKKYNCSVNTVKTWRRNAIKKIANYYK